MQDFTRKTVKEGQIKFKISRRIRIKAEINKIGNRDKSL